MISYAITSGSLPPGMKFDPTNGEVFGNITRNLSAETTYTFTIGATKTGTGYTTETYSKTFTMTVQGVGFGTLTFNAVSSELVI